MMHVYAAAAAAVGGGSGGGTVMETRVCERSATTVNNSTYILNAYSQLVLHDRTLTVRSLFIGYAASQRRHCLVITWANEFFH